MNTVLAAPFPHNTEHIAAELAWLNLVLHRAVLEGRTQNGGQTELFKGLYLSDGEIDRLLRGAGAGPSRLEGPLSEAVGDMRRQGPEHDPIPQMFESLAQNPSRLVTLLVR